MSGSRGGMLALAAACLIGGCGDEPRPAATDPGPATPSATTAAAAGPASDESLGVDPPFRRGAPEAEPTGGDHGGNADVGEPAAGDDRVAAGDPAVVTPGESSCVPRSPVPTRLWPRPGVAAIAATAGGFIVAGYSPSPDGGEEVFVVAVGPHGRPRPLHRHGLTAPRRAERTAPPGLISLSPRRIALATVDGNGVLRIATPTVGDFLSSMRGVDVAEDIDGRFAPTLAQSGDRLLVAYTDSRETPMRVRLATLSRDLAIEERYDLTPDGMGASAPAFAAGALPPELYFIDARDGASPILRSRFGADARPGTPAVVRPVGAAPTPPMLAVAQVPGRGPFVAYTVVGMAASSAIGLLSAHGSQAPVPLVAGGEYGSLHVAAVSLPAGALFAAEAVVRDDDAADPRSKAHQIEIRRVRPTGLEPHALVLRSAGPSAGQGRYPSLAVGADDLVGLTFAADDGVFVVFMDCG